MSSRSTPPLRVALGRRQIPGFTYTAHSPDVVEFKVWSPLPRLSLVDVRLWLAYAVLGFWFLFHRPATSWYPWVIHSLVSAGWAWALVWTVRQESFLVIRDIGVQLGTVNALGQHTVRFIAKEDIQDIIINEAITMLEIKTYLAILVKQGTPMVVVFGGMLPRLSVLKCVYREARAILFQPASCVG
ncbi:hypothetical protein IWQ62_003322 [Dispira parvispora]|uniref:Phosphatidylinositol N-acetylglucosaminyltransferase subunit H conserved domain-containing protein n=1 Tax=Dispira parvispora TaxID=1520584 RepID=A0A9W8ANP2_9FUNG|nr:hypothetical protein IWQ62_003322 [Dispira parvispora]